MKDGRHLVGRGRWGKGAGQAEICPPRRIYARFVSLGLWCDRGRGSPELGFLILFPPKSPVGRLYIHEMAGYRVSPAVNGASAREHERVHTVFVQNGQFQAMKEGGIEYGLPHDLDEALSGEG